MNDKYSNSRRVSDPYVNYGSYYSNRYSDNNEPKDNSRYYKNKRNSLQDTFLEEAMNTNVVLEFYMKNEGYKQGVVMDYDNWCILIWSDQEQYLIFKSGIMSIRPRENIEIHNIDANKLAYIAEQKSNYKNHQAK